MRTLLRREEMNGYPNDKVAVVLDESTRSYYDAEGRLRAVDRRRCVARAPEPVSMTRVVCMGWEPAPGRDPGTFEEYRYDALGRRIAVRSRFDASQCSQARPEPCKSRVTRTVWDGDQLLLELRATGDENLDNHTEWVAYTQGPGIDAPLMVRAKQGGSTHDIIPLANWRGLYEAGVFPDGRTAVDGLDLEQVSWPAAGYTAYFDYIPDGDDKEPVWLGSLMSHKRDASGQLYMRNRYYDPQSGRFTQEDPIGLAGGLNLYGFGGGDPVNYSDPFGLAGCDKFDRSDCSKAELIALRVADKLGPAAPALNFAMEVILLASPDPMGEGQLLLRIAGKADEFVGGGSRLLAAGARTGIRSMMRFSGDELTRHFAQHGAGLMRALGRTSYNAADYLADANHVIQSGTYVPQLNGYIRLIGGSGSAKFAFVGLKNGGQNISTFHIKTAKEIAQSFPGIKY